MIGSFASAQLEIKDDKFTYEKTEFTVKQIDNAPTNVYITASYIGTDDRTKRYLFVLYKDLTIWKIYNYQTGQWKIVNAKPQQNAS